MSNGILNRLKNSPDIKAEDVIDFSSPSILAIKERLNIDDKGIISNFPLINSYLEDKKICEKCPGLESCPKANKWMVVKISEGEDGKLNRLVGHCDLYNDKYSFESHFLIKDYPDEFSSLTQNSLSKTKRVINFLTNAIKTQNNADKPFLYAYGELGCGKTYLISAYANSYAKNNHDVAFMDCSIRIEELKAMSIENKSQFSKTMQALCDVELLVLDEFGNWFIGEYAIANVLYPLLSYRAKNKKFTIISSDFSLNEVVMTIGNDRSSSNIRGKQISNIIRSALNSEIKIEKGVEQKI